MPARAKPLPDFQAFGPSQARCSGQVTSFGSLFDAPVSRKARISLPRTANAPEFSKMARIPEQETTAVNIRAAMMMRDLPRGEAKSEKFQSRGKAHRDTIFAHVEMIVSACLKRDSSDLQRSQLRDRCLGYRCRTGKMVACAAEVIDHNALHPPFTQEMSR